MKLSKENQQLLDRRIAEIKDEIKAKQVEEDRPKMTDSETVRAIDCLLASKRTDYILNHLYKCDEYLQKLSPKDAVLDFLGRIRDSADY